MKKIIVGLVLMFVVIAVPAKAQYNPYLDKKRKNKPSAVMARENKKHMKRQNKAAKRQLKRSRKQVHRKN